MKRVIPFPTKQVNPSIFESVNLFMFGKMFRRGVLVKVAIFALKHISRIPTSPAQ